MAWFGPQAQKMMPPQFEAKASTLIQLEGVIDQLPIAEAAIVKVVASAGGNLLQITQSDHQPRRYFDLVSGEELLGYDQEQAKWLASHYLGVPLQAVTSINFRDRFDASYPPVNRLLPVYEVTIKAQGETKNKTQTAFIYTETGALASLNNGAKANMQRFFKALHTWSWLDKTGLGRVLLVSVFMLTLLAMASTGLYLVFALPKRTIPNPSRRWHRRLAYVLWLPLLGWSASGFYHLLQAQYVQPVSGIRLLAPIQLADFAVSEEAKSAWQNSVNSSLPSNAHLNAITLNQSIIGEPLYRLGVSAPIVQPANGHEKRKARFAGRAMEKSAAYINARTGLPSEVTDQILAASLVQSFTSSPQTSMQLVTQFGPVYDFRNKRLPVWQVDVNDGAGSRLFVDPISGILVDQNRSIERAESLSFSILHKWNLLRPLVGPETRDVIIVITLLGIIAISGFGFVMYQKRSNAGRRGVGQLHASRVE
ncbi:PepSY domain-containing protein [Halioxenophilus aromaticivorans]|uniref:PepSY domain-containing protein n=2 Tax=Halioxenophilus aromaticivorans TaxID=1306992 RepID=A0AAV3U3B3_9ALTE